MLYKMFSGLTSEAENENVKNWAEASEDNLSQMMAERKLYDVITLSEIKSKSSVRKVRFSSFVKYSSYAACLAILLVSSFFFGKNAVKPDISMNTVTVPIGQRVNLVLADGTNLWLNSGATSNTPPLLQRIVVRCIFWERHILTWLMMKIECLELRQIFLMLRLPERNSI